MQVQELVIRQFVCTEKATLKQKLSKLQIEALQQVLHQYTPKERLGTKASTLDGQYWNVEDLAELVREQYGVEYQSRASYT